MSRVDVASGGPAAATIARVSGRYRFDGFELDAEERELRREDELVPLQDLPLRLLVTLVERAPETVSRDALRNALWPPGTHLDVDASLNTAIARVRDALGDDASAPRFVLTVPRRGYRFVATVETTARKRSAVLPVAIALGVVLVAAGTWYTVRSSDVEAGDPAVSRMRLAMEREGDARDHLIVGRHHAERRSREGLERAIAAFQSAAAVFPGSAEAYSGLASSYALLGIYDFWRPREAFGPAETMARRALELDPESAGAHLATGIVAAVAHWDWETATASAEKAVELATDSAEAWFWRGALLSSLGRHEEALASTRRALELDPTSPVVNAGLAWHLFQARRSAEAAAQAHRAIELHPDYYDAWDNLKWIEMTRGHEAAAVDAWIRAEELDTGGGDAIRQNYAAGGLARLHREAIASQVAEWKTGRYQSPYDIALEYAALGNVKEAMVWLDRSFAERETDLVSLAVDPRFDALRDDPRFQDMLVRLDLPRGVTPRSAAARANPSGAPRG